MKKKAPSPKSTAPVKRGLAALMDDDDQPGMFPLVVAAAVSAKKGLASLMDEEPPIHIAPVLVDQSKLKVEATPAPSKKPAPEPAEPALLPALEAPIQFFNVQTRAGVRCTIIDRLGSDWKDVLIYNWDMKVTMHVKIEDLYPLHNVRAAIDFIRTKLRSEK